MTLIILACFISGYLIGSISSAILVCKWFNLPDPRTQGSKNPGATNVYRVGGSKAATWTLMGDALKGFLPVFLVQTYIGADAAVAAIFIATILGHIFPIFFNFRGGKGVATSFGALLALSPVVGIYAGLTWLLIARVFRISSLAALIAAVLSPLYAYYAISHFYLPFVIAMSLLVIGRHKQNILRIISGNERKL